MPERHAILILGMHRSGTSALARVINLLGASLGRNLMPATPDNPRGYWEDTTVGALNDECLNHFGRSWDDVVAMPQGWQDDVWLDDWQHRLAQHLQDNYADTALLAIKDPRLCRVLPAWLPVLERLQLTPKIVLALRQPSEVALSLERRDDMGARQACLLSTTYLLEAEHASRGRCRSFVGYGELLRNWRDVAERVGQQLSLTWPASADHAASDIESFLDTGLRHQAHAAVADHDRSSARALAEFVYHLACASQTQDGMRQAEWDAAHTRLYAEGRKFRATLPTSASHLVRDESAMPQRLGLWEPADVISEVVQARLYYRPSDRPLEEHHHVAAVLPTDSVPMRAEFELPEDTRIDFIRFDPAMRRGIYRLLGMTVNGMVVTRDDMRVAAVHERMLAPHHGELLRFFADDTDPYVEFDIRHLAVPKEQGMRVDIVFECDSLLDQLTRELGRHETLLDDAFANTERKLGELEAAQRTMKSQCQRIDTALGMMLQRHEAQDRYNLLATGWGKRNRTQKHSRRPLLGGWSVPLVTSPSQQLELMAQPPGSKLAWWRNNGADPHFTVELRHSKLLPAGWYVLGMHFCGADAPVSNPCVYVDYGDGFSETNRIPLLVSGGARQRLLLRFKEPVQALRFDPSDAKKGEFLLSPLHLRRITRPEALLRLGLPAIQRMREQGQGWTTIWRESQRSLLSGKLDQTIQSLYAEQKIRTGAGYDVWINACDTLDDDSRDAMRKDIDTWENRPLVSILLPVWNTPKRLLCECLDSVLAQLYPYWELCIADDASTEPHVRRVLENYAARDPRIKIARREINGHISAASNTALELATGEWVALLDHDDLLAEHALFYLAEAIVTRPDMAMIYSDEDKIDARGRRYDPYFKPDWNPELVLAQNMICHLAAYRTEIIRDMGGFREGYEGSQDHDLALRYVEHIEPQQILHLPRILYHWRATSGSTALATDEKGYAVETGRKAVAEHLERIGAHCDAVTTSDGGYYRVKYALPVPVPKVSLIIPTRDRVDLLRMSVGSILEVTDYPDFEIIIADNQSSDPKTLAWFDEITARDARVRILPHDQPFNFSRINNAAVAAAKGDIVGLINNDIEVTHADWLREMVSHAARKGVGAVGAKLYYPDGSIQHAGVILGVGGVAGHAYLHKPHDYPGQMGRARLTQNLSAVTAACLLVRKAIYLEVGGMNEDLEVAFNDIDFCLRVVSAGYRNVWTPHAELIHHESASRGYEDTPEKQQRFNREVRRMQKIWGDMLEHDPAYHPDLSLFGEPFSLDTTRRLSASADSLPDAKPQRPSAQAR